MSTGGRGYRDMSIDELKETAARQGIVNVSGNDREALIRSLEDWEGRADTDSSRLQGKSLEDLQRIAAEKGVRNGRELPKAQLISAILGASEERSATTQNSVHRKNPRARMVDRDVGSKH